MSYRLAIITEIPSSSGCSTLWGNELLFLIYSKMFEPKFAYHPWEYLNDELKARNWTQRQFADIIWIPAPELNAIIKWRKNLTPALCVRIGEAFWTSADLWMNMQTWYSLSIARKEEEVRIKRVHEKLKEYSLEWQLAVA